MSCSQPFSPLLNETAKNTSPLALTITAGFVLLALWLAGSAVAHTRHIGRLRWPWLSLAISLVLWCAPLITEAHLYNISTAIVIYAYDGVLGIASVLIGALRELFPAMSAQS